MLDGSYRFPDQPTSLLGSDLQEVDRLKSSHHHYFQQRYQPELLAPSVLMLHEVLDGTRVNPYGGSSLVNDSHPPFHLGKG